MVNHLSAPVKISMAPIVKPTPAYLTRASNILTHHINLELFLYKILIMAGINQTTMMALSMVVIASMIGARGLGMQVLIAINRTEIG